MTRRDAGTWVAAGGLTALFWATVAANNPAAGFDRMRRADRRNLLLPNWRFFAPLPATHDTHVIYRTRAADGSVSDWDLAHEPRRRAWWNMVVYPGRRREKVIFDIVDTIVRGVASAPLSVVERQSPFRILHAHVEQRVRDRCTGELPDGIQIAVVRHTGYDDAGETEYLLVSKLLPLADRPR